MRGLAVYDATFEDLQAPWVDKNCGSLDVGKDEPVE
jgi:hypothetical protein